MFGITTRHHLWLLACLTMALLALACEGQTSDAAPTEKPKAAGPVESFGDKIAQRKGAEDEADATSTATVAPPSNESVENGRISLIVPKDVAYRGDDGPANGTLDATFERAGENKLLVSVNYSPKSLVMGLVKGDALSLWLSGDDATTLIVTSYLADSRARDLEVQSAFEAKDTKLDARDYAWSTPVTMDLTSYRCKYLIAIPKLSAESYRVSFHFFSQGQKGPVALASFPKEVPLMDLQPLAFGKLDVASLAQTSEDVEAIETRANKKRDDFAALSETAKGITEAADKLYEIKDDDQRLAAEAKLKAQRLDLLREFATLHPNDANAAEDMLHALSPADLAGERVVAFAKRFPLMAQRSLGLAGIIYDDARVEEYLQAVRAIGDIWMTAGGDRRSQAFALLVTYGLSFRLMNPKNEAACVDYFAKLEPLYDSLPASDQNSYNVNRMIVEAARSKGDTEALTLIFARAAKAKNERGMINELYQRFMMKAEYQRSFDPETTTQRVLTALQANKNDAAALYWLNLQMGQNAIRDPNPRLVNTFLNEYAALVATASTNPDADKEELARYHATLGLSHALYGPFESAQASLDKATAEISALLDETAAKTFLERYANVILQALNGYHEADAVIWRHQRLPLIQTFVDSHGGIAVRVTLRTMQITFATEERDFDQLAASGTELDQLLDATPSDDPDLHEQEISSLRLMATKARVGGYLFGSPPSDVKVDAYLAAHRDALPGIVTALLARARASSREDREIPAGALRYALTKGDPAMQSRGTAAIESFLAAYDPETSAAQRFTYAMEISGFFAEIGKSAQSQRFAGIAAEVAKAATKPDFAKTLPLYRRFVFQPIIAEERTGNFAQAVAAVEAILLATPEHTYKSELDELRARLELEAELFSANHQSDALALWIAKRQTDLATAIEETLAYSKLEPDINGASFTPAGAVNEALTNGDEATRTVLLANMEAFVAAFVDAKDYPHAFDLAVQASDVLFVVSDFENCQRLRALATKIFSEQRAQLKENQALIDYLLQGPALLAAKNDFAGAATAATNLIDEFPVDKAQMREAMAAHAESYASMVDLYAQEEAMLAKQKDMPRLRIVTDIGAVEVELFEDDAPNTTASFIQLAEDKYFDGTQVHRFVPHFVVQAGSSTEDGGGAPNWSIANEAKRPHFRGSLAMARATDPDSASSNFYIVTENSPSATGLNASYTVFGRVTKGMEVVERIRVGTKILKVEVLSKRDHVYAAKRTNR